MRHDPVHLDVLALDVATLAHQVELMSFLHDLAGAIRVAHPMSDEQVNYITATAVARWAEGFGHVAPETRVAARHAVADAFVRTGQPAKAAAYRMPPVVPVAQVLAQDGRRSHHVLAAPPPPSVLASVSTPETRKK